MVEHGVRGGVRIPCSNGGCNPLVFVHRRHRRPGSDHLRKLVANRPIAELAQDPLSHTVVRHGADGLVEESVRVQVRADIARFRGNLHLDGDRNEPGSLVGIGEGSSPGAEAFDLAAYLGDLDHFLERHALDTGAVVQATLEEAFGRQLDQRLVHRGSTGPVSSD